jgi:DNA-binding LacI/PurR family transcriptional regulator
VTSADVARAAGVSRAAVSQILNGRGERFAASTRDRVRQAALELNYQPSAAARTLARGASEIVVAVIPHTTFGGNLQDLFDTLTDELAAVGLTVVLRFSTSSPESFDRLVRTMRPLAVVTFTPVEEPDRRLLRERGVRLIEPRNGEIERVDHTIGRMQADHLIERGYTRLAYAHLRDDRDDPFGRERAVGVRAACRDHGLAEPVILNLAVDLDEARRELSALPAPGYGVACYNDDVAIALLAAAQQSGWTVPGDLALIGLDNTRMSRLVSPRLTTIDVDIRSGAVAMARAIVKTVVDEATDAVPPPLQVIDGGTT